MVFLFVGSSGLTEASFPRNLAIPQLLLSSAWGTPPRYERPDDRVPAQGTFTPSVHAHVRRTPGAAPNGGPTTPVGNSRASEGPPSVIRIVSCDMKLQSVLLGGRNPDQVLRVAAGIPRKQASDGRWSRGRYCQGSEAFPVM